MSIFEKKYKKLDMNDKDVLSRNVNALLHWSDFHSGTIAAKINRLYLSF